MSARQGASSGHGRARSWLARPAQQSVWHRLLEHRLNQDAILLQVGRIGTNTLIGHGRALRPRHDREKSMKRKLLAAGLLIICQGCGNSDLTVWTFPPLQVTNDNECIVGFNVTVYDDAYLVDIRNLSYDWDISFDTGIWRSYMTTDVCLPQIVGCCHQEATGFMNSKGLPRFVFKLASTASALRVTGTINVITNWVTWETRNVPFSELSRHQD